jgi:hypothetical protein
MLVAGCPKFLHCAEPQVLRCGTGFEHELAAALPVSAAYGADGSELRPVGVSSQSAELPVNLCILASPQIANTTASTNRWTGPAGGNADVEGIDGSELSLHAGLFVLDLFIYADFSLKALGLFLL